MPRELDMCGMVRIGANILIVEWKSESREKESKPINEEGRKSSKWQ